MNRKTWLFALSRIFHEFRRSGLGRDCSVSLRGAVCRGQATLLQESRGLYKIFWSGIPALLAFLLAIPAQAAFTDNADGTITDTVTGLMWDKCSWGQSNNTDCSGGAATAHTWTQALGVAVTANAASYKSRNDWRLPNKNELESLVKIDASSPAIDTTAFPNTVSYWYWSSTNYAPVPAYAWFVFFGSSRISYGSLFILAPLSVLCDNG